MRTLFAACAVAMLSAATVPPRAPCASDASAGGRFYLEPETASSSDTLRVRLCLTPAANTRFASYHAELWYDSSSMRAVRVDPSGGLQVANLAPLGRVALAGVATGGFVPGLLATVLMRPVSATTPGAMDLRLLELTDAAGHNMLSAVTTTGYSAPVAAYSPRRAPHIDSLSPRRGEAPAEDVLEVIIYGRGFTPANNRVYFGTQKLGVAPSENHGTVTRFHVPSMIPGRRGQLSVRIPSGRYAVRIENANGASNSVRFTVDP